MKIHEYQAKELFRLFGVAVPEGESTDQPERAVEIADRLGYPCVIKAQVHAGGRGKAGGIRLVKNQAEAREAAAAIIGMTLVTPQTGAEGRLVRRVLVEKASDIARELYLAILIDRERECPVIIASPQGGMEIEVVAHEHPELIFREYLHPSVGLSDCFIRNLAFHLVLNKIQQQRFAELLRRLVEMFQARDASLVEINPLIVSKTGEVVALDAKVLLDDNALYRRPDLAALRDLDAEDPREMDAKANDLSFVALDGSIGCIVNGAGLAMATMDMVKHAGGEPANFLDVGGSSRPEKVLAAMRIILSDPDVRVILLNIFGGITRCDDIAKGLLAATEQLGVKVPIVARLTGTNEAEAKALLADTKLCAADTMREAVEMAVKLAEVA